ncbi:MAG: DUF4442 domain-containing protein [Acidobacteriota bacterium]
MTLYRKIGELGPRVLGKDTLFKWGFNLSPMYRRSTARIIDVDPDLSQIRIRLPLSYRNRNYVGSIFGGSMFSAVDPIPMVQLINILGPDYVVWDKSAQVDFKVPAKEDLYASFDYGTEEVEDIKRRVAEEGELTFVKTTRLTNRDGSLTFCEVRKTVFVASKAHYRAKKKRRSGSAGAG